MFVLVFGQTPSMRAMQVSRYKQMSEQIASDIAAGRG
jgi:hypothetical protein